MDDINVMDVKRNRKAEAAEASKRAILDAAETLFAQRGFEGANLQEISARAGVARGLPGYFFGSKEHLYRAVLERALEAPAGLVAGLRERAAQPGASARIVLGEAVDGYIDWLADHPQVVRIIAWEELNGGRSLGSMPGFIAVLQDLLEAMSAELGWRGDARQLVLDLIALCYFPFAFTQTLTPLGLNVLDADFLAQRKRHVIRQLLGEDPAPGTA